MAHKWLICQGHVLLGFFVTTCESVKSAIYYMILNCIINGSTMVLRRVDRRINDKVRSEGMKMLVSGNVNQHFFCEVLVKKRGNITEKSKYLFI